MYNNSLLVRILMQTYSHMQCLHNVNATVNGEICYGMLFALCLVFNTFCS